ncbi:MAG TPA: RNA-binding protein [Saprospiraceae bacterium]|nr:RNA-binding protein [Saprospiraceae bacterium]
MNIFVAKLDYSIQEDELREIFEDFGPVDSVKIIMDKFTGRSKGFGFVEMPSDEDGQAAIDGLNEAELEGRQIVVKKARPREDNRGGGGRRGGGNYNRDKGFNNDRY